MKFNGRLIILTLVLVALATVCKFYFGANLEWSGFSPVIASALFSGFIVKKKDRSFLLPLLAVFLSDCIIHLLYLNNEFDYPGFYEGQWRNYLILFSATLIGWMLNGKRYESLLLGAIIAPTVFFLVSNFNVWLSVGEVAYSRDFSGLMSSYIAGLPFYKNALIATLLFLPVVLFLYNIIARKRTALTIA